MPCSLPATGCIPRSRCASPNIKLCLSEGGIGWVAGLLDRLEHVRRYDSMYGTWNDVELSPAETFKRNFWVCAIDDPSAFAQRHVIGVENILVESDYPHADSTWPNTQAIAAGPAKRHPRNRGSRYVLAQCLGAVPPPRARQRNRQPRQLLTPDNPTRQAGAFHDLKMPANPLF